MSAAKGEAGGAPPPGVRAVRQALRRLAVVGVVDAVATERALAARLALFDRAPSATFFDPLARSPLAPAAARVEPASQASRQAVAQGHGGGARRPRAAPDSAARPAGTRWHPDGGVPDRLAVAANALSPQTPGASAPAPHARATAHAGAAPASALPAAARFTKAPAVGPDGRAPARVLAQITDLLGDLARVDAPPAVTTAPSRRVSQPAPPAAPRREIPGGAQSRPTHDAAPAPVTLPEPGAAGGLSPQAQVPALNGIGRLAARLFAGPTRTAADATTAPAAAERRQPAARAMAWLTPAAGQGGSRSPGTAATQPTAPTPERPAESGAAAASEPLADALARALRTEGELRGVELP